MSKKFILLRMNKIEEEIKELRNMINEHYNYCKFGHLLNNGECLICKEEKEDKEDIEVYLDLTKSKEVKK
jgi:recombinational DNA repair protein RecR